MALLQSRARVTAGSIPRVCSCSSKVLGELLETILTTGSTIESLEIAVSLLLYYLICIFPGRTKRVRGTRFIRWKVSIVAILIQVDSENFRFILCLYGLVLKGDISCSPLELHCSKSGREAQLMIVLHISGSFWTCSIYLWQNLTKIKIG